MTLLVYVVCFGLISIAVYTFVQVYRRHKHRTLPPNLPVPEIPPQLPAKPDPPTVYLDPLLMQMHGSGCEFVDFYSLKGERIQVLVNSSTAHIFNSEGWWPFRFIVKRWADSPAYVRYKLSTSGDGDSLGEMSLSYLYSELLGDAQFNSAFDELVARHK